MVSSARYQERIVQLEKVLLLDKISIDMTELRRTCTYGIPDGLRPLAWRLLLNYLPHRRDEWKRHLEVQRENYQEMVKQLLIGPCEPNDDHPLSDNVESEWSTFFDDNKILAQIDKDCRRLLPEMQFFQLNTNHPNKLSSKIALSSRVAAENLQSQDFDITNNIKPKASKEKIEDPTLEIGECHWQVVERILFIYAKLNPGVKYVQGMNEVLGPLYYVFAADSDEEWATHAEADAFFCFQQLMSEIKDSFIKTLDNSSCGIESSMSSFHNLLGEVDPELFSHIVEKLNISPQYYSFRWLSLLLSQEFPLPDVITIWDSLFSDQKRFSLLPFICLAMLRQQRDTLLKGEFSDCIFLLQNYPAVDVNLLVSAALSLREERSNPAKTNIKQHKRTLSDKLKELSGYLKR